MTEAKPNFKRRKFFIKKEFQSRFILVFCLLVLLGAIISTSLTIYFSQGNLTSSFSKSHLEVTTTAAFVLPAVIYTNLITIIIISLSILALTLFVSHKIAGPLFRIEKDIKVIAEGDLTHIIYLRQKDQIRELSIDINKMTTNLKEKMTTIHDTVAEIMVRAKELDTPQWFHDELHQLQDRINQNFKLKSSEKV
jgi:methyl-accepting chemotaxis protein